MFGKKNKPFFVAEISSNHNGNFNFAKKLIKDAKVFGASAVKLQTYSPKTMTVNSKKNTLKLIKVCGKVITYGIYIKKRTSIYMA